MRLFWLCLIVAVMGQAPAWGESSWDKLLKEIDEPDKGAVAPPDDNNVQRLDMPDMAAQTQSEQDKNDDARAQLVTSYKCDNPSVPDCLLDLKYHPRRVDFQNCRDLTKLYLQAVASYNRCVDRRSRKHARHIVNYFNCVADKRENCPLLYGDD